MRISGDNRVGKVFAVKMSAGAVIGDEAIGTGGEDSSKATSCGIDLAGTCDLGTECIDFGTRLRA